MYRAISVVELGNAFRAVLMVVYNIVTGVEIVVIAMEEV